MKIKIPSKKIIVLLSVLLVITGIFASFVYPRFLKKSESLKYEGIFYEKIFSYAKTCSDEIEKIKDFQGNNFDKKALKKVITICNNASYKVKNTPIPQNIPQKNKKFLKNSQKDAYKACKYTSISYKYLLKTNGEYDWEDENYQNHLKNFDIASDYAISAYNNMMLLFKTNLQKHGKKNNAIKEK